MNKADWPMAANYAQMLQNPKSAFLEDDFRGCEIKRDKVGQPFGVSGAFAVVYKATLPSKKNIAMRVFTSFRPEVTQRYDEISAHLTKYRNLNSLVDFKFYEKGIKVLNGKGQLGKYPLVTMEWVQGETLYEWAQGRCNQRKKRDLSDATNKWRMLIDDLRGAHIAHGDLQHANIMVTDAGEFKLVDYDCMCVPSLVGERNLEIGVEPYQHPGRDAETKLSPKLDDFSSIFIFVALRALANDQSLWDTYIEGTKYDKLLFRTDDFESPNQSDLYKKLMRSGDPDLGRMAKDLAEIFRLKMDEVPSLEDFLFSFDRIATLLDQGDFDKAVDLLDRNQAVATSAPSALQPRIQNARQRVECRQHVQQMVDAGDEQGMAKHYNSQLLSGYPKAAEAAAVAKDAEIVIPVVAQLNAAKQRKAWRDFVRVWESKKQLLSGRLSCAGLGQEATQWQGKNDACDAFLRCINRQPEPDVAATARTWQSLEQLGGHPEADAHRNRVASLLGRQEAWTAFEAVADAAKKSTGQEPDQAVVSAWNDGFFKSWNTAERRRPEYQQAQDRLGQTRQLQNVVQGAPDPPTVTGEERIVAQAKPLPAGYQHDHSARVKQAADRVTATDAVCSALVEPASEHRILSAWSKLKPLQGESLVDHTQRSRIQLAERRAPLVDRLKQIPTSLPLDQLDGRILAVWQPDILRECHDVAPWCPVYHTAKHRKALLAQLGKAINDRNEQVIVKAATDPCLKDYPLPRGWLEAIGRARDIALATEALVQSLQSGDRDRFCEKFHTRIIRTDQDRFKAHRDLIMTWVQSDVLTTEVMGLSHPMVLAPLSPNGTSGHKLRWTFPKSRFSDQCLMAVSRGKPSIGTDPRNDSNTWQTGISRESYEKGGGYRVIHPPDTLKRGYVTIYAVVDLGFCELISEPLVLGRL